MRDKLEIGTRVTLAQDVDLRGHITISTGTVVHPKASILALGGPIKIGNNCIVEEHVTIINRSPLTATIGDSNLFEVGARVECRTVGDHNVFEIKSRVGPLVAIGSYCTISAGCTIVGREAAARQDELNFVLAVGGDDDHSNGGRGDQHQDSLQAPVLRPAQAEDMSLQASSTCPIPQGPEEDTSKSAGVQETNANQIETIPDYSVVFGSGAARRKPWSGEASGQEEALHVKHLDYLRHTIPRSHKLRVVL